MPRDNRRIYTRGATLISTAVLALLAIATYRGTRLAVHDTILDPVRNRVFDWRRKRPGSAARTAVAELISCIYCMGWWVAGVVLAGWFVATGTWGDAPVLVHGIEWFGVAGAGVLLNRWDDTRDES
jgi:hypothetical protein